VLRVGSGTAEGCLSPGREPGQPNLCFPQRPPVTSRACTVVNKMARYTGPPMDLTNMRSLGVTRVDVYCGCGHQASVDVSELPGDLAVPAIKDRLRCSKCGARPMETRPTGLSTSPKAGICQPAIGAALDSSPSQA
jgi:hypothetical protein